MSCPCWPPPRDGVRARAPGTRRGFTLIELLIVITIIAILAALIFPVFARARGKARQVCCASNMKQLATAYDMYVQDYDEVLIYTIYPATVTWPNGTPGTRLSWGHLLYPYVRNIDVYTCPDSKRKWDGGSNPFGGISINPCVTYMEPAAPSTDPWANSLADLDDPSRTVMLTDTGTGSIGGDLDRHVVLWWRQQVGAFATVAPRHSTMCNLAFVDGHVKAMPDPKITGDQPYHPVNGHPLWTPHKLD